MRVDGLNIVLRQRAPWEAVDLGMGLVRRHARLLFGSWALATLPVFLLLHALCTPFGYAWVAGLLFWWLKPAFDRLPLYVFSRGILGQKVGLRETLRQMGWGWGRLLPWLLWRRLHPARSLLMAVDFLEQPRGQARSERVRLLGRGQASAPGLTWVVGAHLELMLWGSLIVFVLMLIPIEFLDDSLKAMYDLMIEEPPPWAEFLQGIAYWLAMLVVEPFYMGAGFALYLNRRTELEAWDVELAFRRLAQRAARLAGSLLLGLSLLALVAGQQPAKAAVDQPVMQVESPAIEAGAPAADQIESATGELALSQDSEVDGDVDGEVTADAVAGAETVGDEVNVEIEATTQGPADNRGPAPIEQLLGEQYLDTNTEFVQAVDQVFSDSDLNPKKMVGTWERIEPLQPGRKTSTPAWLRSFSVVVAWVIENALWVLLAIAVIWLLYRSRHWWSDWISTSPAPARRVESPVLDPKPSKALPEDVPAAVRQLWQQGQGRAALSLLYRGAVACLARHIAQPLPPGATEAEVLRRARRLERRELADWLGDVVRVWQAAAYAHRLPDEQALEGLLQQWPQASLGIGGSSA